MTFYPTFTATNVALAGSDLSINKTKEQKINLLEQTMKSRSQDAADDVGNFFQGNGTIKQTTCPKRPVSVTAAGIN